MPSRSLLRPFGWLTEDGRRFRLRAVTNRILQFFVRRTNTLKFLREPLGLKSADQLVIRSLQLAAVELRA
jgi:hypothetical protein